MPPPLIAVEHRAYAHGKSFHAIVHARVRDLEPVEVPPAASLEPPPPRLFLTRTLELRDELVAILCVAQRGVVDAQLAADHRPVTAFHLASHHQQVAVDARASQQDHVTVDREHPS